MKPKTKKPKKKVVKKKIWLVLDGRGIPLDYGSIDDNPRERMLLAYTSKEHAKEQWNHWILAETTITYSLPK